MEDHKIVQPVIKRNRNFSFLREIEVYWYHKRAIYRSNLIGSALCDKAITTFFQKCLQSLCFSLGSLGSLGSSPHLHSPARSFVSRALKNRDWCLNGMNGLPGVSEVCQFKRWNVQCSPWPLVQVIKPTSIPAKNGLFVSFGVDQFQSLNFALTLHVI